MTKTCFKCKKTKPLIRFYKHKAMLDGHLGKCIECTKMDVSSHRSENLEKIRAYDRKRNDLPHRKALLKERAKLPSVKKAGRLYKKNWAQKNQFKRKAQHAINNAIRDGCLFKKPCEVCGSIVRIHGHHEDYTKPLDVVWLCPKHHAEVHKVKRWG